MHRLCLIGLFICLLCSGYMTSAQVAETKVGPEPFLEGKAFWLSRPGGWEFTTNQDTSWASIDSIATDWQSCDIRFVEDKTPTDWNGIGWFRLKMKIDSSLFGRPMAIAGISRGAAEIYLNGKLISRSGKIGKNSADEIAGSFLNPLPFTLGDRSDQTLLIRFSNFDAEQVWNRTFTGLHIFLCASEDAYRITGLLEGDMHTQINRFYLIFGFLIALSVLHFVLFAYYPAEKANLTCALFYLFLSGMFLSGLIFNGRKSITAFIYNGYSESLCMLLSGIILPFFVYQVIKRKINWLPVLIAIAGFLSLIVFLIHPFAKYPTTSSFLILSVITGVAIVLHARFKGQKKELNIILVFYVIAFLMVLPGLIFISFGYVFLWGDKVVYMNLAPIVGACGYSFYLAKGVAMTNRDLSLKLTENEKLAQEKLQVEKDKQLLIEKQKDQLEHEVAERTIELRSSLKELKETQAQLIQQEKLASLGELTAGIAHEIQNPLNFVNNFSDISSELIDEMNEEIDKGDFEEVKVISADLKDNLNKIHHHGQRADSIVKGMLEHSRTSTGEKIMTDLNAQVDEFLKLAYHGIRAKDKSFNAAYSLDPDPALPMVNIIPQDIGRVFLNLINNAFYAVNERKKTETDDYHPAVTVHTKYPSEKDDASLEVIIKDNGNGIPPAIREKIFQPFFTTKPTGSGTGLGLSLAYDIIKAHGGQLIVESETGIGTQFIVILPVA